MTICYKIINENIKSDIISGHKYGCLSRCVGGNTVESVDIGGCPWYNITVTKLTIV